MEINLNMRFQRVLVPLFTLFWWKRLFDLSDKGYLIFRPVIKVKSWNTAIIFNQDNEKESLTFCLPSYHI